MKRFYPFLFAILPVVETVVRTPGYSSTADIGVVIGFILAGCALLYLLVALASRAVRWPSGAVPVVVFTILLWFYGKAPLGGWTRQLGGSAMASILLVLLLANAAAIWWLARQPRSLDKVNTFFALTGVFLTAWLGFRFAANQIRARSTLRHSVLARELARPVGSQYSSLKASQGPARDIYLIVLDEYANARVLKELYRFDNRAFEDSLERLGFTIPTEVHSNYVHTSLSLPSLLNFTHLAALTGEVGSQSNDLTVPHWLLENSRTVAFLKSRGYRFLFFPSQWYPSTRHNRNADWEFEPWSRFSLSRQVTRSDLRRSLVRSTALGLVLKDDAWDGDYVRKTLAALEHVPEQSGPAFAFAHIISPHAPFVLRSDCRTLEEAPRSGPRLKRREAYIEQLECLNRLVLGTVTTILRHSTVAPIIVLQGDHGSNVLGYSRAQSARTVSPAQARERFGAFGAYYAPDGGGRLFADSVTMVNVFQKVLNYYFAAGIPAAPDKLYMSLEKAPYDFVGIDPASLATRKSP